LQGPAAKIFGRRLRKYYGGAQQCSGQAGRAFRPIPGEPVPRSSPVCIVGFMSLNERVNQLGIVGMAAVRDNKAQNRFELDVDGDVAFANYRLTPSAVIINHTETPRALRGRGIASELVRGALELIRADGRKVIAGCGFVVDYLRRNPEFADLTG
jgi:predicted GNAT family acetyltransferase